MQKQIILLENDDEARSVLSDHLQEAGYKVLTPVDSYVGLEIAGATQFDLILLNDEMPIINGPNFLKSLRSSGVMTPAVIFTQNQIINKTSDFEALLPCTLVQKPFQIDVLLTKIDHMINS